MKISIVVTTYNRPDALVKVLDGLIHQTCLPDEIVVADDGSSDETRACLKPFLARTDIRIIHVWQEDKGFRAARIRNKAISSSTGDYLILLDGDCIPEKKFVADHRALAEKGCFFQGKRALVNEKLAASFDLKDMASTFRLIWLALCSGISNRHHILRLPFFPSYKVCKLSGIRSCNMGIFKDDVKAVNGFNQDFIGWGREDTEFAVRLFRYGLKRKENLFRAICYHLWHRENPRDELEKNDSLLELSEQSGAYYCESGIADLYSDDTNSI